MSWLSLSYKTYFRQVQKVKHYTEAYLKYFNVFSFKEKQINFNHFSDIFSVCKLYKLGLYITTYFRHRQCFISEVLVLAFIKTKLGIHKN